MDALARRVVARDFIRSTIVFYGNTGCGKTMLCRNFYRWLRGQAFWIHEKKWNYAFPPLNMHAVVWPEICDGFKVGLYGVVDDLCNGDFVFIDDIGAEYDPSRIGVDKLCQILSRREKKYTLITTNISPEMWGQKFDARIEDRLLRNGAILVDMSMVPSFNACF